MSAMLWTADNPALNRACDRKTRYTSEGAARRTGQDRCRASDGPVRLWTYPCAACRGWHLTRTPNRFVSITAASRYEGVPL